jgi:hypothetical protein
MMKIKHCPDCKLPYLRYQDLNGNPYGLVCKCEKNKRPKIAPAPQGIKHKKEKK